MLRVRLREAKLPNPKPCRSAASGPTPKDLACSVLCNLSLFALDSSIFSRIGIELARRSLTCMRPGLSIFCALCGGTMWKIDAFAKKSQWTRTVLTLHVAADASAFAYKLPKAIQ